MLALWIRRRTRFDLRPKDRLAKLIADLFTFVTSSAWYVGYFILYLNGRRWATGGAIASVRLPSACEMQRKRTTLRSRIEEVFQTFAFGVLSVVKPDQVVGAFRPGLTVTLTFLTHALFISALDSVVQ
ncbi:hypothetical protein EVAR_68197_1 [Eumeta japonica]|uniref:Uncharacterized protein n=1 Tax=Eumeta variegata TaxID=151549 RepID=A0A4C2A389_EUMVA|nr:hypothetical protein EVAR_68197_1 [Eumeta japonica]